MAAKGSDDLYLAWQIELAEISERYGGREMALPYIFDIGAASLVLMHGLTPENVKEWVRGRISEFERIAKEANPNPRPVPRRRRKSRRSAS